MSEAQSDATTEVVKPDDPKKGRPVGGDPHPDVYIIEGVLRSLAVGEQVTKEVLAASIGLTVNDWPIVLRRVYAAQKRLSNNDSVNIHCVTGVGYRNEPGGSTVARVSEGERKSMARKAKKNLRSLMNVDAAGLSADQRFYLNSTMTIMAMTRVANSYGSQQKMIAAHKAMPAQKRLPMADALNVLRGKDSP